MARIATSNLALGTWAEGDNPGAGSQTVLGGGGLNDNWNILDVAVGVGHTAAGAHKDNIIDKNHLKTTAADGSTLELNASVGLRAKDDGITGAKLAAGIVDNSTLEATAATGAKTFRVKDAGITGAKLAASAADASTLEVSGGSMRIKNDGVTAAKISHNNNRTKSLFTAICDSSAVNTFAKFHGVAMSATLGILMPRAGAVTKMAIGIPAGGSAYEWTYGTTAPTFAVGDRLYFRVQTSGADQYVQVYNITTTTALTAGYEAAQPVVTGAASIFIVMEVEFDD